MRGEAKLFYVPVSAAGMLRPPCIPIMCFEVSDNSDAVIFAKNTYGITSMLIF